VLILDSVLLKTVRMIVHFGLATIKTFAREAARSAILTGLAIGATISGKTRKGLGQNRVQMIYLHHVYENEERGFRKLLERLSRSHSLLQYSEAVDQIKNGPVDRPYVGFSVDDGLRNSLRIAEILEEYDARACFFVCPGGLDAKSDSEKVEFCAHLGRSPEELLDWDDINELLKRGHEVGGHTVSHRNLAGISANEAADEISKSFEALKSHLGSVDHFAWPFGRFSDSTPAASRSVFAAGYATCASAVRGAHVQQHQGSNESLCIRREHILGEWPLSHTTYLLARSVNRSSSSTNTWPAGWEAVYTA
jgi:peptidoglycan/xylan/chitin deacetylase (PgdA/CDA1 family)